MDVVHADQPIKATLKRLEVPEYQRGVRPIERWNHLVEAMTDSDRLVVWSWVGCETGGYDHERFAQQMRGLPPIDWDTQQEMVIAEPFFSDAVHDAVVRAGRAELLIDLVRHLEGVPGRRLRHLR